VSAPTTAASRSATRPRPARRRAGLRLPLAAAVPLALALAGCGGSSSSPGVAHVGATSAASAPNGSGGGTPEAGESRAAVQQKLVKFAQCMRTHGEPEFPEPVEGDIEIHSRNGSGPNPESPQWKAAEKACSKYAPPNIAPSPAQQKAHQEQALKFSECMRHHGVPNFPDPKFSSGGGVQMSLKGINPGSPQFQAAQKACQSNSPLGKALAGGAPAHAGSGPSRSSSESAVSAP
jgi:hypothetical protein